MPPPRTVRVNLAERSYPIVIGRGLLASLGRRAADLLPGRRCAVVTDSQVAPLYAEPVLRSLTESGIRPTLIKVPSGETSKSMDAAEEICRQMIRAGLDRKSFLVALGGGVIGDLAGFAASIFLRGIPFIQVPTTLLAQVDSCVGGKTGVNTPEGKNLIGTFDQPRSCSPTSTPCKACRRASTAKASPRSSSTPPSATPRCSTPSTTSPTARAASPNSSTQRRDQGPHRGGGRARNHRRARPAQLRPHHRPRHRGQRRLRRTLPRRGHRPRHDRRRPHLVASGGPLQCRRGDADPAPQALRAPHPAPGRRSAPKPSSTT